MIIISKYGYHAKIRSLFLHEDIKLQITKYLHTYKFKLSIANFIKFIENKVILTFRIEKKISISYLITYEWLYMFSWKYKNYSKNIYFDDHKHENIIINKQIMN